MAKNTNAASSTGSLFTADEWNKLLRIDANVGGIGSNTAVNPQSLTTNFTISTEVADQVGGLSFISTPATATASTVHSVIDFLSKGSYQSIAKIEVTREDSVQNSGSLSFFTTQSGTQALNLKLNANGSATVSAGLTVVGDLTASANLAVTGNATVGGNLDVTGALTSASINIDGIFPSLLWGTEAQVKADPATATFYTNSSGAKFDKNDDSVTFTSGDNVNLVFNLALTENLVLDGGGVRVNISQARGLTIDLGVNAGNSNIPFKVQLINADQSTAYLFTNKDYEDVITAKPSATRLEQSVISNQTQNSNIWLNGRQIFGRRRTEDAFYDPLDPYSVCLDGTTGVEQSEYKDLFDLVKFTATTSGQISSAITNSQFTLPDWTGKFSRSGHGSGTNQASGSEHLRLADGVSFTVWPGTANNLTVDLVNASNLATLDATAFGTEADNLVFLQNLKGLRITAATSGRIPDSSVPATTIILKVDISTPSAVVLTLVNSITKLASNANATDTGEQITIDNSGDVAGSREQDEFQGHYHKEYSSNTARGFQNVVSGGGAYNWAGTSGNTNAVPDASGYIKEPYADGANGTPRTGKENHPESKTSFKIWQC